MSILSIENLYYSFGKKQLLSGIYIQCIKGEVLGLMGSNGSGKSTLFKIITGMISSPSVALRIDNKTVSVKRSSKYIAYLPQESFLPQDLRINKCIRLLLKDPSQRHMVSNDKRIKELNNRKTGQLSGGERRYLELLLILAGEQEYVLLDEPFSKLDPLYKEKAVILIKNISDKKGIIITDQDYRSVFAVSTSRLLLINGNLKNITTEDELMQDHYLPGW